MTCLSAGLELFNHIMMPCQEEEFDPFVDCPEQRNESNLVKHFGASTFSDVLLPRPDTTFQHLSVCR